MDGNLGIYWAICHTVWSLQNERNGADMKYWLHSSGGGQAKICGTYAENLFRVMFGTHPPFFSINHRFFPQHFQFPPIFFRKCKFFPLKFGDPPTFLPKIHIYQIFDILILRPLSVHDSLYSGFLYFHEFLSFWAIQACKIVKTVHFWCPFSVEDQKFSLIHHRKNMQDHWKNLHFGLLGTH